MSKASDKRLAKVRNLILRTLDEIIRDELVRQSYLGNTFAGHEFDEEQ